MHKIALLIIALSLLAACSTVPGEMGPGEMGPGEAGHGDAPPTKIMDAPPTEVIAPATEIIAPATEVRAPATKAGPGEAGHGDVPPTKIMEAPPTEATATIIPLDNAPAIIPLGNAPTMTPTPTLPPLASQGDDLPRSSPSPTTRKAGQVECVVGPDELNLREGPGQGYGLIETLPVGLSLTALKCAPGGTWLLVQTPGQAIGWVRADLVSCRGSPADLPVAAGVTVQPSPALSPRPLPSFTPSPAPAPTAGPPLSLDNWLAEYYDNPSLLGQPALVRTEPELDFNWILGSPAPNIPADNFSARWRRLYNLEGADYRFFAEADDGVKVYITNGASLTKS